MTCCAGKPTVFSKVFDCTPGVRSSRRYALRPTSGRLSTSMLPTVRLSVEFPRLTRGTSLVTCTTVLSIPTLSVKLCQRDRSVRYHRARVIRYRPEQRRRGELRTRRYYHHQ